jgi:hypothetical protein
MQCGRYLRQLLTSIPITGQIKHSGLAIRNLRFYGSKIPGFGSENPYPTGWNYAKEFIKIRR